MINRTQKVEMTKSQHCWGKRDSKLITIHQSWNTSTSYYVASSELRHSVTLTQKVE